MNNGISTGFYISVKSLTEMVIGRIVLFLIKIPYKFESIETLKHAIMKIYPLVLNPFADRLSEGGPMMYLILICFLLSLFFIIMAFVKRNSNLEKSTKMLKLCIDSSLLALVLGCLGSVVGIITLFDMLEAVGETRPDLFAAGIKVALLTITFGLFSFAVARVGILIYKWSLKSEVV